MALKASHNKVNSLFQHTGKVHEMDRGTEALIGQGVERRAPSPDLVEKAAWLQAILDTTVDGIITIDEHTTVQSFNKAAERIFGYSAGEVIGKDVNMLMPSP